MKCKLTAYKKKQSQYFIKNISKEMELFKSNFNNFNTKKEKKVQIGVIWNIEIKANL